MPRHQPVPPAERQQQRRLRNKGEPRAGSPEQAAEIERLLAMVAERDQALAALEDARLDAQSYASALTARIAELKAQVAELTPEAGRRRTSIRGGCGPSIRLNEEQPLRKDGGYTIHAFVVELSADGKVSAKHGLHEFLQLPAHGDRIVLPTTSGAASIVRVVFTEHRPRWPSPGTTTVPAATVFVTWIEDVD